jgi:ankyrin repeat protein
VAVENPEKRLAVLALDRRFFSLSFGCLVRDPLPLHAAAARGGTATLEVLLAHGGRVDSTAPDGRTPLHAAAMNGRTETVEYLLDQGADVNAATSAGANPLQMAVDRGRPEAVRVLLGRGADSTRIGAATRRALRASGDADHKAIAELLRRHEADR